MQKNWLKWAFASSWIAFAAIALLYGPVWTGLSNVVKGMIGLAGTAFIVGNLVLARRWLLYAFSVSVGLLLVTYAAEFFLRVSSYMAVDPDYGLSSTIWLKLWTRYSASMQLACEGLVISAITELYWTLIMPVLQLVLFAILLWQITRPQEQELRAAR